MFIHHTCTNRPASPSCPTSSRRPYVTPRLPAPRRRRRTPAPPTAPLVWPKLGGPKKIISPANVVPVECSVALTVPALLRRRAAARRASVSSPPRGLTLNITTHRPEPFAQQQQLEHRGEGRGGAAGGADHSARTASGRQDADSEQEASQVARPSPLSVAGSATPSRDSLSRLYKPRGEEVVVGGADGLSPRGVPSGM